jgi:choline dehydrogenase
VTPFDDVVVGAGSAGCVLANRLSADPGVNVLLIEAGGPDTSPLIAMPMGYTELLGDPATTWRYPTRPFGHSQQVEHWCGARRWACPAAWRAADLILEGA